LLRRDGSVWSTDKDGMALCLLAAEISAKSGKDPSQLYADLIRELGEPFYERRDTKATREEKARLQALGPADLDATELAGEPIRAVLSRAPGNDAPIGGIKVVTENGWFAARPSGTEDVAKIYAESFRDRAHLQRLQDEAEALLARAFKRGAGAR
jgi:phosphoglucomutase